MLVKRTTSERVVLITFANGARANGTRNGKYIIMPYDYPREGNGCMAFTADCAGQRVECAKPSIAYDSLGFWRVPSPFGSVGELAFAEARGPMTLTAYDTRAGCETKQLAVRVGNKVFYDHEMEMPVGTCAMAVVSNTTWGHCGSVYMSEGAIAGIHIGFATFGSLIVNLAVVPSAYGKPRVVSRFDSITEQQINDACNELRALKDLPPVANQAASAFDAYSAHQQKADAADAAYRSVVRSRAMKKNISKELDTSRVTFYHESDLSLVVQPRAFEGHSTANTDETQRAIVKFHSESFDRPFDAKAFAASKNKKSEKAAAKNAVRESLKPTNGRKEAILGADAPTSDYLGSGSTYSDNSSRVVRDFIAQLINPWSPNAVRLPDCSITPTAVFKLFANRTYTVASVPNQTQLLFGLHSRLCQYGPVATVTDLITPADGAARTLPPYSYNPGNILSGLQFNPASISGPFSNLSGNTDAWGDDFGAQQTTLTSYIASYRVLSMGVRVRVVGLPPSTFLTPGKIYFAQVRCEQSDMPVTEQEFVTLERLGRGTHVSMDAVREAGSKTYFCSPDGPEKFHMSTNFVMPPGMYIAGSAPGPTIGHRYFPRLGVTSTLGVFGNLYNSIIPYDSSPVTNDTADSACADGTYVIIVGVFGSQPGVVLEVDYALNGEYIPTKTAPPGIDTAVQVPSALAMDKIFTAAALATEVRPVMLQAAGDTTIGTGDDHSPRSPTESGRRLESLVNRSAGGVIARRREGFFDSIMDGLSGAAHGFVSHGPLGALTGGLTGAFGKANAGYMSRKGQR